MHKGPVTVITTEYGTRLDNQPVSRSATVDGVPDFVNLYEYDDQDHWSETYTGDGTTSTSDTSSNNVSGSVAGSSTHDWSWSYEGSCSSGSGSGSSSGGASGSGCGSSGTSSSNWSNSYDETVSYPGFYSGAYYTSYGYGSGGGYAGDEPLDYLGDDFSSASSSGYAGYGEGDGGYFLYSEGDQQSTWLDDGSEGSSSRPTDNGQDRRSDPRGKGPAARDRSGSGNGDGSQGDENEPLWLEEWELKFPFLEELDELREHLAREQATREQIRQSAEQLWQELDQINRGKHGSSFFGDLRLDPFY